MQEEARTELADLSSTVRKEDEAMKSAISGERSAKVIFLDCLVAVVAEALPAISSRAPASEQGRASSYGKTGAETRWFEGALSRALLVSGSERPLPPIRKIEGVEPLNGKALYLTDRGEFWAVSFSGRFHNLGSNDSYWWQGTSRGPLSAAEVVEERWSIEDIAQNVSDELQIQLKGKKKAREKAERVAERVRQCAELLKGVR